MEKKDVVQCNRHGTRKYCVFNHSIAVFSGKNHIIYPILKYSTKYFIFSHVHDFFYWFRSPDFAKFYWLRSPAWFLVDFAKSQNSRRPVTWMFNTFLSGNSLFPFHTPCTPSLLPAKNIIKSINKYSWIHVTRSYSKKCYIWWNWRGLHPKAPNLRSRLSTKMMKGGGGGEGGNLETKLKNAHVCHRRNNLTISSNFQFPRPLNFSLCASGKWFCVRTVTYCNHLHTVMPNNLMFLIPTVLHWFG